MFHILETFLIMKKSSLGNPNDYPHFSVIIYLKIMFSHFGSSSHVHVWAAAQLNTFYNQTTLECIPYLKVKKLCGWHIKND